MLELIGKAQNRGLPNGLGAKKIGICQTAKGQKFQPAIKDCPLPEIEVRTGADKVQDNVALINESCKLVAIAQLRDELLRFLPGSELLPPTNMHLRDVEAIAARLAALPENFKGHVELHLIDGRLGMLKVTGLSSRAPVPTKPSRTTPQHDADRDMDIRAK